MTLLDWQEVDQKLKEMAEIARVAEGVSRTWGGLKEQYYELIWIKWNLVIKQIMELDNSNPLQKELNEKEHLYHDILRNLKKVDKGLAIWAKVNLAPLDN